MSDWRDRVDRSQWRYRKVDRGDVCYALEAQVWGEACGDWEEFGLIDMSVANEGQGESVATSIVEQHNNSLAVPEWKSRIAIAARKLSKIIDDNNAHPGDRKFAEAAFEALLWALGSSGHDRMDQLLEDA